MTSRQLQIKHAAAELFVASGVGGTSVRDIAERVGMLSGSLYHHFPSKDAIAFAIISDFLTDLNSRYESVLPHVTGMREELRALVHSSLEVAAAHPYATEIYQNERTYHGPHAAPEIAEGVERAHTFWVDSTTRASGRGELRPELDPTEVARMLREAVWWSVRYHRDSLAQNGPDIANSLLAVFIDGAAAQAARLTAASPDSQIVAERLSRVEEQLEELARRIPD